MFERSFPTCTRLVAAAVTNAFVCTSLAAQVGVGWQTQPLVGPFGLVQTTDMDVTASGIAYVCGFVPTQSGGSPGLTLTRIEPNGSIAWSQTFPIGLTETPFVAASPSDGASLQVASYFHFAAHHYRTWAIKYDSAGNVSWSMDVPGLTSTTEIRRATRYIGVDALGNAYVGGSSPTGSTSVPRIVSLDSAGGVRFSTPLTLTLGSFMTAATVDVLALDPITNDVLVAGHAGFSLAAGTTSYVARLTSAGAVSWVRETPAPAGLFVWVRDIGIDGQGRVSTLEQHSTSDSYTNTVSLAVIRRDAAGAPAGSLSFPTSSSTPQAIDVGADGTVIVSGHKPGPLVPGFVTRYDGALSFVWEQTLSIPGSISVNFTHVTLGANGDITASGPRHAQRFSAVEADMVCARFDAAGNLDWQYQLGWSEAHEIPVALDVDEAGRARLALHQMPSSGSPYSSRQITLELDPEAHSLCHGDGTAAACPCGNSSGVLEQAGCRNSTGQAAKLDKSGTASLSNDTLVLTCSNVDANAIGLLAEGTSNSAPIVFGDGLFCVGGSILRLFIQAANTGVISLPGPGDPAIHVRSASLGGPISAGQRRTYQTWYRDASLTFCPSGGTFNFSNALLVLWAP